MPVAPLGTKEVRRSEGRPIRSAGFDNIQPRLADGFDYEAAFGAGNKAITGIQNVILVSARAGDPDDTVLALDRGPRLPVIQVQNFAGAKE